MKYVSKKAVSLLAVLMILALMLSGCGAKHSEPVPDNEPAVTAEACIEITEEECIEPEEEETVLSMNLLAVGDNLIHAGLYNSGMNDSGDWNYDHLYQYMKEDIQAADLAVIDQETILVENREDISSYPNFGSPVEIGDAVAKAGFDVVLHATNHTLDKGTEAVWYTLNFWSTRHPEITVLGINASREEKDTVDVVEVNGIKLAMLNFTYGVNSKEIPEDLEYMVNMLDMDQVKKMVEKAKEVSDMVVFFCHVGDEYVYEPSEYSKEWVNYLLELGVDIALDCHTHVLEPYTVLTREDGHRMLVYYSLGNFISTQDEVPRLLGGMAKVTIEKHISAEGTYTTFTDYSLTPVVAHWNHETMTYATYKLSDYTDALAETHGIHAVSDEEFTVEALYRLYDQIMHTAMTPATDVLTDEAIHQFY